MGFLPWREVMAIGLGRLLLSSEDFWALTPREFERALTGALGDGEMRRPIDRTVLDELMRRFPDRRS